MNTLAKLLLLTSLITLSSFANAKSKYNIFSCNKDSKLVFSRTEGVNPIGVMAIYGRDHSERAINCEKISKSLTTYFNALSSSTLLTMKAFCDHRPGHEIEAFRLFIKGSPYWDGRDIVKFKLNSENNQICEYYADSFDDFLSRKIR